MQSGIRSMFDVDWTNVRRNGRNIFAKLIRTRSPNAVGIDDPPLTGRQRLARCLSTLDLTSLGVGSCVGTGMYLVSGIVARRYAGPAAALSFCIAAAASIFSGACYAEFGVRIPNTTGSAYTYTYTSVGEFLAFVIGWNMILEYLIGTSACARALSSSIDALFNGAITHFTATYIGTYYGKPPDILAFLITMLMTLVLVAGVRKSLFFNNVLNAITLSVWVFTMISGLFYVRLSNWTDHKGFLPYGWGGVFSGAATSFYAFIGFDIIATTGEEAHNPKRSIPLAIVLSLGTILVAYVTSSIILTLIVPYDEINTDSAMVQMFSYVHAPACAYIVSLGAVSGLTVSMFGSMFPMPRVMYAMALDGLIYKRLATISPITGTPAYATFVGGIIAAALSLMIHLNILVEMMSVGTLLAYTLVSICVLVLRYQPNSTNLTELLPQSIRAPSDDESATTARVSNFAGTEVVPSSQRVMVRRVTRSSPDSDDSMPGEDSDEFGHDDTFLVNSNTENYYVTGGCTTNTSRFGRICGGISRRLQLMTYLCPAIFPWVENGPATKSSGLFVTKAVGVMLVMIITLDVTAAFGHPGSCSFTAVFMICLAIGIATQLMLISRKPQNRANLIYATPWLPFVPTIAVSVNVYLILNLSVLTLVRFTVTMIVGLTIYFKYGIKNSTLENKPTVAPMIEMPTPNPLDRTTIPPPSPRQNRPVGDRNIFEGDGNNGLYGNIEPFADPLSWHVAELEPEQSTTSYNQRSSNRNTSYMQVESRYNERTNRTSSHTHSRPPWAYPDSTYETWEN